MRETKTHWIDAYIAHKQLKIEIPKVLESEMKPWESEDTHSELLPEQAAA